MRKHSGHLPRSTSRAAARAALRVVLAAALVALLPGAAHAQSSNGTRDAHFALREIDCKGVTVAGSRLPTGSVLRVTLVNKDTGAILGRRNVRAPKGRFSTRMQASTRGMHGVRAIIATSKGERLGWVDHSVAKGEAICRLPFTGPFRPSLALLSAGLLATGAVMVRRTRGANAYWPTAGAA